jgi:GntR family transcriptional regulator
MAVTVRPLAGSFTVSVVYVLILLWSVGSIVCHELPWRQLILLLGDPMDASSQRLLVRTTLYEQICRIVEARIADGTWPEQSYLPNEMDLSSKFGVSIGTVRKAIDILVGERLLERHPGRGTMVADRRWMEIRNKTNRIRHGEAASVLDWSYRELMRETIEASGEIASRLKLRSGDRMEHVRRLRSSEDGTLVLEDNFMPLHIRRDAIDPSMGAASLAVKSGFGIGVIEEHCWAVLSTTAEAMLMEIPAGEPLLRMIRIVHDRNGTPVEYREAWMHTRECYYYTRMD